jgi:hypothetical protein
MEPKDVHACCILLNAYLKKFGLHTIMSDEEFAHFMLPRPGVISSFVVQVFTLVLCFVLWFAMFCSLADVGVVSGCVWRHHGLGKFLSPSVHCD